MIRSKKIGEVQNWLKRQPKNFFSDGIKKLAKRWNRWVKVEGITLKSDISLVSVHLK
jgi:hypothetical protein